MTLDEFKTQLANEGWHVEFGVYDGQRTGCDWWAWRRHVDIKVENCIENDKPPQICIVPWLIKSFLPQFEFILCGKTQSGVCVQFKVYGILIEDVESKMQTAEAILIEAWNSAAKLVQ